MIETTETLRWALLVFAIFTGTDGSQTTTHSPPSFHGSISDCTAEGERFLAVVEPAPGAEIRFACIPRDVLREDLAMFPQPRP